MKMLLMVIFSKKNDLVKLNLYQKIINNKKTKNNKMNLSNLIIKYLIKIKNHFL